MSGCGVVDPPFRDDAENACYIRSEHNLRSIGANTRLSLIMQISPMIWSSDRPMRDALADAGRGRGAGGSVGGTHIQVIHCTSMCVIV